MALEIERRFLVDATRVNEIARGVSPVRIEQGYLTADPDRAVRVRTVAQYGFLTIKGRKTGGVGLEHEYEIPASEARELLELCIGTRIVKDRYHLAHGDLVIELDVFRGALEGLVVAEIELPDPAHPVPNPGWFLKEVTDDPSLSNQALAFRGIPA